MPFTAISSSDSKTLLAKYFALPQPDDQIQVMYIWIDGTGEKLRCKTMTVSNEPQVPEDCPVWNFDGSSTGQADRTSSDVYLKPCKMFRDPFRGGKNKLLLCETIGTDKKAHPSNHRQECSIIMERVKHHDPWFGIEQEYILTDVDGHPLHWPKNGYPAAQGPYYCGVGAANAYGRDIVEAHYRACIYAGLKICGTNAEVVPAQWEFQLGPLHGLEISDQLWMARFLLHRVAEDFGVAVTLNPKPVQGEWNGSGAHTNFSTIEMRDPATGNDCIAKTIAKLADTHTIHLEAYAPNSGKDNLIRLTGNNESSAASTFTSGVANRSSSVRIPRDVSDNGCGYLEDRRPAANCDPYRVVTQLMKTLCIDD